MSPHRIAIDSQNGRYEVVYGAGVLSGAATRIKSLGKNTGVFLLCSPRVARHWRRKFERALRSAGLRRTIVFDDREESKNIATVERVCRELVRAGADRRALLVAAGGGVVGDVAGFVAASYLRGVGLVHIPTTLVAQVDSAIGGKTGVNLPEGKNLVGAFYSPQLVLADPSTLATLPDREFREGLAEVIKYGAIMDAPMIADLERDLDTILARRAALLEQVVTRSLIHKAAVVSADERESGLRKTLNFGHTIGHAIEASAGYGSYFHGEAVAIGMIAASRLSCKHAGFSADEASRLRRLIERAGLPTAMPAGWHGESSIRALGLDKKRAADGIEFVLLDRLGHSIVKSLSIDEITAPLL